MDYYKPYQNLSFIYNTRDGNIYLKSSVNVYLPAKETLASQDASYDGKSMVTLKFKDFSDVANYEDYLYCHDSLILIIEKAKVRYDASNSANTKSSVQKCIQNSLASNYASFYTVTAIAYKIDGTEGGQVTNTITHQGEVIIL
jgi:hypothetical protein